MGWSYNRNATALVGGGLLCVFTKKCTLPLRFAENDWKFLYQIQQSLKIRPNKQLLLNCSSRNMEKLQNLSKINPLTPGVHEKKD